MKTAHDLSQSLETTVLIDILYPVSNTVIIILEYPIFMLYYYGLY
jgi:hypothetical protein